MGSLWVAVKLTRRGTHPKSDTERGRIAEIPITHSLGDWVGGDGN